MTRGLVLSALRAGGGIMQTGGVGVAFMLLIGSMFGIALAPMPQVAAAAAPAIIILCVLLAAVLSLESIWHRPLSSGRMDVLLLSGCDAFALVTATTLAHGAVSGLPLVLAAGVMALMFNLPLAMMPALLGAAVMCAAYLSLTGAVAALLSHGARHGGMLLVVLITPLQVPMVLLALLASAQAQLDHSASNPYLYLQGALLVLAALPLLALSAWLLRVAHSR